MPTFHNTENHARLDWNQPPKIVLLDAVGTVLTLRRSVADIYHETAKKVGIDLPKEVIKSRFLTAFVRCFTAWQPRLPTDWAKRERLWLSEHVSTENWLTSESVQQDFQSFFSLPIDESREMQAWKTLVAEVLAPLESTEESNATSSAFHILWELFAQPSTWQPIEGAVELIGRLHAAGVQVGLASNFDRRLHQILTGFVAELDFDHVFVSSDLGYRKPDPRFYHAMIERLAVSPKDIVMVGDRWWEDFAAPTVAGIPAFLYSADHVIPQIASESSHPNCLRRLLDLVE